MKTLKQITINLLMILGVIAMVSMTSCSKDSKREDIIIPPATPPTPISGLVINVKTPGTLWQKIRKAGIKDSLTVKKLTLSGTLNGADVLCLRRMTGGGKDFEEVTSGQLSDLTFTNVSFQKDPTIYYIETNDDASEKYHIDTEKDVLPKYMFCWCKLKSFTISSANTIKVIGDNAFSANFLLTDVSLAEGVTDIGEAAFRGSRKLENVHLSKGLMNIHTEAFNGCTELTNITIDVADAITLGDNCFNLAEDYSKAFLYVPKGTKDLYTKEGSPFLTYFDKKHIKEQK